MSEQGAVSDRRGIASTGAGIVVSTLATFATTLVLVSSTPHDFADMAVLTVAVLLVATIGRLGADRFAVAEIHGAGAGEGAGRQRGADLSGFALSTAVIGFLLLQTPLTGVLIERSLSAPLSALERALLGLWYAGEVVRFVAGELHRARFAFGYAAVATYGLRAPAFLAVLLALRWTGGELTRTEMLIAAAASSFGVAVWAVATTSRVFPWWHAHPLRSARSLWAGHVAMLVTTFTATLVGGADIWMLGASHPAEVTASYSFAVNMVAGLALVAAMINGGVLPQLAAALTDGDTTEIQRRVVRYVRRATLLVIVLFVGVIVLAQPIAVLLGGHSYDGTRTFVIVLGLGQVVSAAGGIPGSVIIAARRYTALMWFNLATAALTIIGEAVAAFGLHSPLGVAIASGLGTALLVVGPAIYTARTLRLRSDVLTPAG